MFYSGKYRDRLLDAQEKAARLSAARRSAQEAEACDLYQRARVAIEEGEVEEGARLLADGIERDPQSTDLIELASVCDMRLGLWKQAVARLGRLWDGTARQRYLLCLAKYGTGDLAGAHLDLVELSKEDACPSEARVLLGLIHLERGEFDEAECVLEKNLSFGVDALTCQAVLLTEIGMRQLDEAGRVAVYLANAYELDEFHGDLLSSVYLSDGNDAKEAPQEMVARMGRELVEREDVIGSLVVAQKNKPQPGRIQLLRGALGLVIEEMSNREKGYLWLGELALLAGDGVDARRWVELGLVESPYSAELAMLLDRIHHATEPTEATARETIETLEMASEAKPGYGDLRRALILMYREQGYDALAKEHAQRWMDDGLNHPLAERTLKEIAA